MPRRLRPWMRGPHEEVRVRLIAVSVVHKGPSSERSKINSGVGGARAGMFACVTGVSNAPARSPLHFSRSHRVPFPLAMSLVGLACAFLSLSRSTLRQSRALIIIMQSSQWRRRSLPSFNPPFLAVAESLSDSIGSTLEQICIVQFRKQCFHPSTCLFRRVSACAFGHDCDRVKYTDFALVQ